MFLSAYALVLDWDLLRDCELIARNCEFYDSYLDKPRIVHRVFASHFERSQGTLELQAVFSLFLGSIRSAEGVSTFAPKVADQLKRRRFRRVRRRLSNMDVPFEGFTDRACKTLAIAAIKTFLDQGVSGYKASLLMNFEL